MLLKTLVIHYVDNKTITKHLVTLLVMSLKNKQIFFAMKSHFICVKINK